ncbi:hypothetical protein JYU34_021804 [Plutella xylostella]|uniref:RING-type domain-containing protein n=1 Tax=Plutella xylostella TaxID=51655 RepID=A0ABQ7PRY8_PLUXY|nr:hypothetical protein JYU34_021804 [Plutella xylostella]
MDLNSIIQDLFYSDKYNTLNPLLDRVNTIFEASIKTTDDVSTDFVDNSFYEDLQRINLRPDVYMNIGKSLRDIKCIVLDDFNRQHTVFITYKGYRKLVIKSTTLPKAPYIEHEFGTIDELVDVFKDHIDRLINYFMELERIDSFCCIVDPVHPTFKDEYRKIYLEERVWLHVEVTAEGLASNMHLVGNSPRYTELLKAGLTAWDHDKEIVENIMDIFDIQTFPQPANPAFNHPSTPAPDTPAAPASPPELLCGICLCEGEARPQPLCANAKCGQYFHAGCLYQWLVACAGGRAPTLGVAAGQCPGCFHQISCSERDL